MSVSDLIRKGVAAHQAGALDEAGQAYAAVLDAEPDNPDGLHFSGLLKSQQGEKEEGPEVASC